MNTSLKEDEMLNCPDCQLQTLQQQQQQQQNSFTGPGGHIHPPINPSQQPLKEPVQLFQQSRNSSSCDLQNLVDLNSVRSGSSSSSAGMNGVAYQAKGHQVNSGLVSGPAMSNPYKNSDGSISISSTASSSCTQVANTMTIVPVPMLSGSSTSNSAPLGSTEMLSNNNPCLTPLPLEGCDISGYCATCAVLDLPPNDKYYRPSLPRHSVFPSMFYGQNPIPGYSPIPDCNLWGNCNSNDYAYSYSTYPQQTSSNDYYTTTQSSNTVLPSLQSPSDSASGTHLMSSCSFSFSSNNLANVLDGSSGCYKKSDLPIESLNNKKGPFLGHSTEDDEDSVIPICISSSSEDTSDSGSFISQREVIVEDDDSGSMTLCHIGDGQKCTICQNPVLSDCPYPQLANILENIHEDITAEDLDITVSSGDIEIGGIEDEVRDFHPRSNKSSFQSGPQISLSRLAYLLNIPLEILLGLSNSSRSTNDHHASEHDIHVDPIARTAVLCSKCNKLVITVDSLEKQLRSTCSTLKEFLQPQMVLHQSQNKADVHHGPHKNGTESLQKVQVISSEACKNILPPCHNNSEENELTQKYYSTKNTVSKFTQTDVVVPIDVTACLDRSNECIIPFENLKNDPASICTSLFQCIRVSTCTKDTMTDCDGNIELCLRVEDPSADRSIPTESNENTDVSPSTTSSGDPHNFENSCSNSSSIGNINLECDIHDINCSFIPELRRKDLPTDLVFTEYGADELLVDEEDVQLTSYLCEQCGKILSSRRTFETHFKRHGNDLIHKCPNCGKGFANEASLQIHIRTHTGEKPFSCSKCGKAFATKSNMISHQDICKEYSMNGSRNSLRNKSSSLSPLKLGGNTNKESCVKLYCYACGLCFRLKERLESHLLKGCSSKVLECSTCQKKFSKHSEMKVHMLIHNGEKPYVCNVCGISFATKGNQISHSRTHSIEKRFKCEICDKGFNRKQALQLHFNRHKGIKPFACEICERKFYDPSNLQNHKKTHIKKDT